MERLRGSEDVKYILLPSLYYASSIVDMVSGKAEVIEEKRLEIRLRREELHGINSTLASRTISKSNRIEKSQVWWAVVTLPVIRHDPKRDDPETNDRITIFDPTGEVKVMFPQGIVKKFANHYSKSSGIKFDPQLLKERSWLSDVILLSGYNEAGENIYYLIHVKNRMAPEPDKNRVPFSARGLSLGEATV